MAFNINDTLTALPTASGGALKYPRERAATPAPLQLHFSLLHRSVCVCTPTRAAHALHVAARVGKHTRVGHVRLFLRLSLARILSLSLFLPRLSSNTAPRHAAAGKRLGLGRLSLSYWRGLVVSWLVSLFCLDCTSMPACSTLSYRAIQKRPLIKRSRVVENHGNRRYLRVDRCVKSIKKSTNSLEMQYCIYRMSS